MASLDVGNSKDFREYNEFDDSPDKLSGNHTDEPLSYEELQALLDDDGELIEEFDEDFDDIPEIYDEYDVAPEYWDEDVYGVPEIDEQPDYSHLAVSRDQFDLTPEEWAVYQHANNQMAELQMNRMMENFEAQTAGTYDPSDLSHLSISRKDLGLSKEEWETFQRAQEKIQAGNSGYAEAARMQSEAIASQLNELQQQLDSLSQQFDNEDIEDELEETDESDKTEVDSENTDADETDEITEIAPDEDDAESEVIEENIEEVEKTEEVEETETTDEIEANESESEDEEIENSEEEVENSEAETVNSDEETAEATEAEEGSEASAESAESEETEQSKKSDEDDKEKETSTKEETTQTSADAKPATAETKESKPDSEAASAKPSESKASSEQKDTSKTATPDSKSSAGKEKKDSGTKDKKAAAPSGGEGKGLIGKGLSKGSGAPKGRGISPTKKAAVSGKKAPTKKGALKGGLKNKAAGALANRSRKKAIAKGENPDSLKNKAKQAMLRRLAILVALNPITWIIFFGLIALVIVVTTFAGCLGMIGIDLNGANAQAVEQHKTINYLYLEQDSEDEDDEEGDDGSGFDGEWVLFNQNDPNWPTKITPQTDGWGYACGVVCGGMVLATYGGGADKYDPDFVCTELCGGSAAFYHGATADYLNAHQDIFHLEVSDYWENFTDLKSEIQEACDTGGGAIIYCHTCCGQYWNEHWIIITAMENGQCTIADPAGGIMYPMPWSDLANNGGLGSTMIFKYNGPKRGGDDASLSDTAGQGDYSDTLMIGDSIMVNTSSACKSAMPGITINADSSRSLENGGVTEGSASDCGVLDYVRAQNPKQYKRYVIGTGNNDYRGMSMEAGEEIVSCLSGRQIWFVTEYVSNNSEGTRITNETIDKLCSKHKNVHKVNWNKMVTAHESEYLQGDNCHPQTEEARDVYARLIKKALDSKSRRR